MKKILAITILLLISLIPILYFDQGTSEGSEGVTYLSNLSQPQADNETAILNQGVEVTQVKDAIISSENSLAPVTAFATTSNVSIDPGIAQTEALTQPTSPVAATAQAIMAPASPAVASYGSAKQIEMLGYINASRAQANLAPLVLDISLSEGAYLKSKDMALNGYFSHDSATYGNVFAMMTGLGINYGTAGENIAKNFGVKAAFDAFMNSPGHRANLLDPEFNKIGLGFYQSGNYLYVTQWFTD